jgi:hypothetical protein
MISTFTSEAVSPTITALIQPTIHKNFTPTINPRITPFVSSTPTPDSFSTSATPTSQIYSTPFDWSDATYEPITQVNKSNYEPHNIITYTITLTPSPPEQCPQEDQSLTLNIPNLEESPPLADFETTVLDFLNTGGKPNAVINTFFKTYNSVTDYYSYQDLTGDGVPEFAFTYDGNLYIFGCRLGKYVTTLKISNIVGMGFSSINIGPIIDLNLDGIPEVILRTTTCNSPCLEVRVYEWDGNQFKSLIRIKDFEDAGVDYAHIESGSISLHDLDGNGLIEIVLDGGIPSQMAAFLNGFPFRNETQVISWNGMFFVQSSKKYSPSQYRFQAVQDGDRASLSGDYDKAVDYYQQAIFNDKLDWWSEERYKYILETTYSSEEKANLTQPPPDPNEYHNLAAYSRYRIMLLHFMRGWLPEAQIVYNTLQAKFPDGQVGHFFAEMATAFWDEYQKSQNIGEACGKAIEYASTNSDMLAYLGGYYHGRQSLYYQPEDICPFK